MQPGEHSLCAPEHPWRWRLLAGLLILGSAGLRLAYLASNCPLDLAPDEAHYWDWSRHLDWSYYSKGPLVALLIRGSCELFGPWSVALTGTLGYAITGKKKTRTFDVDLDSGNTVVDVEHHSNRIEYGFAVEYSLPYLRSQVRDLGFPQWVNQLSPLVEFAFSTPVTGRFGEQTTGAINPGIIWSGQHIQLGIEAIIPATRASGKNVGVLAQVHWYLDDIFPQSIGRPLIGTPLLGTWTGN